MGDDHYFSSRPDNKRKFDHPAAGGDPSPPARRSTGFLAPIASSSPPDGVSGGGTQSQSAYNSVPPPLDGIQLAKQRAQEIAARLFSDAEAKRPRVENGGGTDESNERGFGTAPSDYFLKSDNTLKPLSQTIPSQVNLTSQSFPTYGYQSSTKKIEIPNGRVGVIIGKSGETIKYLQLQSGAKIQITRDVDADPNLQTRSVDLVGTAEQISKAEQLINDVLAEADAGASGIISARKYGGTQPGAEQFEMKVPNTKVGLVIGKGGETIKNMQAKSGARIQVIPLHLPPGDTSTERTVYIDGTKEQIEGAKQLVYEVISENRVRNTAMSGGYSQQGYHAPRPPMNWGPPAAPPMQQPGYGYMPLGPYAGQQPQYNMPQPPYSGYPPPSSTGFSSGWDQTSNQSTQQTAPGNGYDYYNQQYQQQEQSVGISSTPAGSSSYNYGQPLPNYNSQVSYADTTYPQTSIEQQGYGQDVYSSGYNAPGSQPGYSQPAPNPQSGYDQHGYGSTPGYGTMAVLKDGSSSAYGAQGGSTPVPLAQPLSSQPSATQGYSDVPNNTAAGYPTQGYGTMASQPGQGSQPTALTGYGQAPPTSYGQPSQIQKSPGVPPVYGHGQQATPAPGAFTQSASVQPGYGQSPVSQSGYGQQQSYGVSPQNQPGYGQQQQQQPYKDSYSDGAQGPYDSTSSGKPPVSNDATPTKAPAT